MPMISPTHISHLVIDIFSAPGDSILEDFSGVDDGGGQVADGDGADSL